MIESISIKNYKSVVDVSIPLGRFNVIIGSNGSGKSNILEGIAMGAAACANKLDFEYFANRGIRMVEPQLMCPIFEGIDAKKITIRTTHQILDDDSDDTNTNLDDLVLNISYNADAKPARWVVDSVDLNDFLNAFRQQLTINKSLVEKSMSLKELEELKKMIEETEAKISSKFRVKRSLENGTEIMAASSVLEQFLIYSLEESLLRKADNSNKIYPLGRHGEGLFSYLKSIAQRPNGLEIFNEIKQYLRIIDWFDDMEIPNGQLSMEYNLRMTDTYLSDTINLFDQRSTNEGFLYLLFYLTLIISDETPKFFAIENIDTAFNPKLCREIIKSLIKLARKYDKQIIATTHNAAVLDGLNLHEDDVCLHVVRRTIDGYTTINKVSLKGQLDMPLSEAWLKGYIGGLPDNF